MKENKNKQKSKFKDFVFCAISTTSMALLFSALFNFSDFEFLVAWSLLYLTILKTLEYWTE